VQPVDLSTGCTLRWGGAGCVLRRPSSCHEQDKDEQYEQEDTMATGL